MVGSVFDEYGQNQCEQPGGEAACPGCSPLAPYYSLGAFVLFQRSFDRNSFANRFVKVLSSQAAFDATSSDLEKLRWIYSKEVFTNKRNEEAPPPR